MRIDVAAFLKPFTSRFVYMIGDDGAILVYMEKDKVVRRLFAQSPAPEHIEAFLELFKAYPKAPIYALIDVMDQSYVRHKLPPVTPLGLNKLVARRLERDFGKDDIKGALNLGREKDGRKDWNFLLISLSTTDVLKEWMNLVFELPNYFGGIYLVPVECEYVVTQLAQGHRTMQSDHVVTPDSLPDIVLSNMTMTPAAAPLAVEQADIQVDSETISPKKWKMPKLAPKKGKAVAESFDVETKAPKKIKPSFSLSLGKKKGDKAETNAAVNDTSAPMWQVFISQNKVGGFRQVVLREGKLIFTRQAQSMDGAPAEMIAGSVEQELHNTLEYLKRLAYNPKEGLEVFILISEEIKGHISTKNFQGIDVFVLTPFEAAHYLQLNHAVLSSDRFGDIVIAAVFGARSRKRLKLNMPYPAKLDMFYKLRLGVRVTAVLSIFALFVIIISGVFAWVESGEKLDKANTQKRLKQQALDDIKKTSSSFGVEVDMLTDTIEKHKEISQEVESPITITDKLSTLVHDGLLISSIDWKAENVKIDGAVAAPADPATPTQKPTPSYTLKLAMDVIYHAKDWKEFLKISDDVFEKFSDGLPNYEVKHTNLTGAFNPNDAIEIRDDVAKEGPKDGEKFPVTFDIKWPIVAVPDASATPNAAAPAVSSDD